MYLAILVVVGLLVGEALAAPVLIPDLLAAQSPPQPVTVGQMAVLLGISFGTALLLSLSASHRHRSRWWVAWVHAGVLVLLSALVAMLIHDRVAPKVFGPHPGWTPTEVLTVLAVCLTARLWYRIVRRYGGRYGKLRAHPAEWPPAAGEVWLAMVPYRESGRTARHYCVVLAAHQDYAEVLQITSKNKDGRDDHIRMGNKGWNRTRKPCWIEVGLSPRQVPYSDFLTDRPQGPCPAPTWRQIQQRQESLTPARRSPRDNGQHATPAGSLRTSRFRRLLGLNSR